jgi:molybdenum cofactor sulfurtransferase
MYTTHNDVTQGLGAYPEDDKASAEAAFLKEYPTFATTAILDDLRRTEYARLDANQQIYLDYTGGGLYGASQIQQHLELLSQQVLGNPHSHNPTSMAMTELVEHARSYVLEYFNADPDEYEVVFTPNASGALKLLGEAYPFDRDSQYVLSSDNHNSVNGIREYARRKGAIVTYVPVVAPDLRLDAAAMCTALDLPQPASHCLLAYPAQSNFSGVQHGLEWIGYAQARGWHVLLDAAAFAPSNRLDLSLAQPDFVVFSFYKIIGYPTGVGALIARKAALAILRRPWFAGGTITIASVQGNNHYLLEGSAAFEDGTVNYLNIPAIETGLRYIAAIGIDTIHERVLCLAGWILGSLLALHHSNGQPMVHVHGPKCLEQRGGSIAFYLFDPDGKQIYDRRVEELANQAGISLRTGCFCNPGAGEIAHGLSAEDMCAVFQLDRHLSYTELYEYMQAQGKDLNAVRISVGLASTFEDAYSFLRFIASFRDLTVADVGMVRCSARRLVRSDTA